MFVKEAGEYQDKYSLRSRVFQSIRQDILKGRYDEGEFLNEMAISKELGVSRTPVREAIRQLEFEGLLYTIPNKGTVVYGVNEDDLVDIYEIRNHIEGLAAKKCAMKRSEADLKELRHILDLMEYYYSKEDAEHFLVQDELFHHSIYNLAQSRTLKHILKDFHIYTERYRHMSVICSGRMKAVIDEHNAIYDGIMNQNEELAAETMRVHVKNAMTNILDNLKKKKDKA